MKQPFEKGYIGKNVNLDIFHISLCIFFFSKSETGINSVHFNYGMFSLPLDVSRCDKGPYSTSA